MTPTDVTLDDLRRSIDEVDQQLHSLLMRRAELAQQIGQAKSSDGPFFRPGREAQILRTLLDRHHGALPPDVVVRLWREIMAAMLAVQWPFSVAVPDRETAPALWDAAREHFGISASTTSYPSSSAVVRAVGENPAVIGVLPWPRDDDTDPWWPSIAGNDGKAPRIVTRLPLIRSARATDALVLARVPLQPSGDDRSLVAVETLKEISRARLLSRLKTAGCEVSFITSHADDRQSAHRLQLIEVAGFVGPGDAQLAAIEQAVPEVIGRVVVLGAYAVLVKGGSGTRRAEV